MDLEDSVPQHLKGYARTLIKDAIANVTKGGAEAFTRINHDLVLADLEGIVWPGLAKVNYPKAEYAEEIQLLDSIISRLEKELETAGHLLLVAGQDTGQCQAHSHVTVMTTSVHNTG